MIVSKKGDERDQRGIDGILFLDESRKTAVNVQVVTAPNDPTIWRAASKEPTSATITNEKAADWIYSAIERKCKTPPSQRTSTILAIDIRHFGMLADSEVAACYTQQYGIAKLGFDSVWLVGPVVPRCRRLHAD